MSQQIEYSYKPGAIRSLKLVNFMCHESFELNFGSRVNFVIGPNGSGKSALLTAVVVVLGGRATTTSRAKRVNEFVMYGKKFAKIVCVLHNYEKIMEKDQAFKPDEYGKRIVIEKIIYNEDTSKLVLKNDKDKKVSERKQELDEILEHFGILINNPVIVLNQEISKSFLHSKKPEDKFDLFMKATNLEQIEQDYEDAKRSHKDWSESNSRKSSGFRILDSEYNSCKEKISFLIDRVKLQDSLNNLGKELVWAMIRDYEEKSDATESKIQAHKKKAADLKSDSERRTDLIEKCRLKIEALGAKMLTCNQEHEASKKKYDENRQKESAIKCKGFDVEKKIEMEERLMRRLENDKQSLEKSIAEHRRKLKNDTSVEENERRKLEIERLEREMPSEKAREKTIRQHNEQLTKSMTDIRSELHRTSMRLTELETDLSSKQSNLRRLKGGQGNALMKYGDHMVRICEEIEKAHNAKHFIRKPLGPMGHYIHLNTPDIAFALELHLGRNAHAFICDNTQDFQTLQGIIRRVQQQLHRSFREPLVIIRKTTRRHDVSRYKSSHEKYKTLIEYINIKEDAVYNALVDRTCLEQILFIPDYKEAENLMITPPLIPRYTRSAYTQDGHVMYPRTTHSGYRSVAPNSNSGTGLFTKSNVDQIREIERTISVLEADIRDVRASQTKLQESYDVQRREHDANYREIRNILDGVRQKEQELLNLKTTLTSAQPEELSAFEMELEACLGKIVKSRSTLEQLKASLESIEEERKDILKQRESILEILDKRSSERKHVQDEIDKEKAAVSNHEEIIKENELTIKNCGVKITEEMKNMEKIQDQIAAAKREATSAKPNNIRETSVIQAELKKTERQLNTEIEENADPDELLEQLLKRKREIESLVELKNHNLNNFELSSKALKDRDAGFKTLRTHTIASVSTTFSSVTRAMGMNGELTINLVDVVVDGEVISKGKTLEMSIDTTPGQRGGLSQTNPNTSEQNSFNSGNTSRRGARSQPAEGMPRAKRARLDVSPSEKENKMKMTDTRSLSGGERSFSTVAFVLALWHHCASPFKLMDEIDVFMDMVTRRLSYNALIRFAQVTENPGQFIFFSPLELPRIDDTANMVRVFEMPKIIRKGAYPTSQPTAGPSHTATAGGDH